MSMAANATRSCWTYHEACRTIPYVRRVLGSLRASYVAAWHFYRLTKDDDADYEIYEQASRFRQEGLVALDELDRLGVFSYEHPARGIALFPFFVHVIGPATLNAYYVYKDTRESIDSFVYHVDLCERNDLYSDEKPVPSRWRQPGTIPKL